MKTIGILIVILVSQSCWADSFFGPFRFRARESYENLQFTTDGTGQTYKGLTNTINIFYEKPFNSSLGLAFGSIFGSLSTNDGQTLVGLDKKLNIYFAGFEYKVFVWGSQRHGLFLRPGIYWQFLGSDGINGNIDGTSFLIGAGYEFLITDSISLAPEFAHKLGSGGGYQWAGQTYSLGLHFYSL